MNLRVLNVFRARRPRGRLVREYFLISVLLVGGGLIASGVVEIYFRYQESREQLALYQHEVAAGAAFKIERFVQEIHNTLKGATRSREIAPKGLTPEFRFELEKLLLIAPAVTEAVALDDKGAVRVQVSRLRTALPEAKNLSETPSFRRARDGKSYFGAVYFVRGSEPYMTIAVPIERFAGDVIGVLQAEVNLKYIGDVVSNITVGQAGYAYAVTRTGELIAHPDISLVLQRRNVAQLQQVKAAFQPPATRGGGATAVVADNLEGTRVLSASALIPILDWAVILERPIKEAYETIYASMIRTATLLLVGLGMALFASYFIARRVIQPLATLREGAERIGGGDLSYRLDVKTGDEIETLADEFNKMTERLRESYAGLEQKVEERTRELTEALEQQTATGRVLSVIASSPTDLQPVLDTVIENAVRLAGANQGHIREFDGERLQMVASYGETPEQIAILKAAAIKPDQEEPGSTRGLAFREKKIVHISDIRAQANPAPQAISTGARTLLSVPLLREGTPIGVITIWRTFVEPFSDRQIELVKSFADQAVIAIENVRLFKEIQDKNRVLMETLEQQTATSEILRVIAGSPTDIQPVLDVVAESAARLCEATDARIRLVDGDGTKLVASFGSNPAPGFLSTTVQNVAGRTILQRQTIHISDLVASDEYPESKLMLEKTGTRAILSTPLLREGTPIGVIVIRRTEARAFSDKQIALLKTFADQAVIAIENVRLFQEIQEKNRVLTETLEQQTATGEILRVIAASPTDIQPVLDAVAESAARLCAANDAIIRLIHGEALELAAHYGSVVLGRDTWPVSRTSVVGAAVLDRRVIHVEDLAAVPADQFPETRNARAHSPLRTVLAAPLVREGQAIGAILIRRFEVRPFTDKQIALLKTFADQAVIAIENVRLFQEIEEKNKQLEAASRHKSQFLANMSHELRTPLNAIIGFTRLVLRKTEGQIAPLQTDNLQKVLVSSEHLLNLINGVLDLSKVEAGRMEVFAETFKLDEIVRLAVSTVEPMLKDGRVRLRTEIAPEIPPLRTDRDKLKQSLLNLLSNAAKFTEKGEINVSAWSENGSLKLVVADTGIGMTPEALKVIFDEFRQADMSTTRKYGGTGLGLALVKKFVELMGGQIAAESEAGRGSKFTITMPIAYKPPQQGEAHGA